MKTKVGGGYQLNAHMCIHISCMLGFMSCLSLLHELESSLLSETLRDKIADARGPLPCNRVQGVNKQFAGQGMACHFGLSFEERISGFWTAMAC